MGPSVEIRAAAIALALALATGCATIRSAPSAGEPLAARVDRFWTLREAKDLAGMYELYSPAYRATVSKPEFLKLTRLVRYDIVGHHVVRASPDGDRAQVTVAYTLSAPLPFSGDVQSELTDTWIRATDRRWYKERDESVLPFPDSAQ